MVPNSEALIAFGLARVLGQDVLRRVFGDRVMRSARLANRFDK